MTIEMSRPVTRKVSPSGCVRPGEKVNEAMTLAETDAVIQAYAQGAATAEALGSDGVEIRGAHGYLVDPFFWHETSERAERQSRRHRNRNAGPRAGSTASQHRMTPAYSSGGHR